MAATATRPRSRRSRRREEADAQARAQRSGGPEDRALYRCSCGHAFRAPVTTSVPCPKCGTGQAW